MNNPVYVRKVDRKTVLKLFLKKELHRSYGWEIIFLKWLLQFFKTEQVLGATFFLFWAFFFFLAVLQVQ